MSQQPGHALASLATMSSVARSHRCALQYAGTRIVTAIGVAENLGGDVRDMTLHEPAVARWVELREVGQRSARVRRPSGAARPSRRTHPRRRRRRRGRRSDPAARARRRGPPAGRTRTASRPAPSPACAHRARGRSASRARPHRPGTERTADIGRRDLRHEDAPPRGRRTASARRWRSRDRSAAFPGTRRRRCGASRARSARPRRRMSRTT